MKKIIFALILALPLAAFAQSSDIINKSMKDEMARVKKLQMKGMDAPYFTSYFFYKRNVVEITASLGSVVADSARERNIALVLMRTGSKKLDNTGYGEYSWAPTSLAGDGYNTIRTAFWQASDRAYKSALEKLSGKKALMQQKNMSEEYDDFSPAPKVNVKDTPKEEKLDREYFAQVAKDLSSVGLEFKELKKFVVNITLAKETQYYLDSAGSTAEQNNNGIFLEVETSIQTKDGFEIKPLFQVFYASVKDVPHAEELKAKILAFAKESADAARANKAESYVGPVWFDKGASVSFLNNVFVKAIIQTKPLLLDRDIDRSSGEFAQRVGLRVISNFFDVYDDPSAKEYKGKTLAGHYTLDDEGVMGQKVEIVTHGKLENLLTTRSLIKGQKTSNGHARDSWRPRANISNIFFVPGKTIAAKDMKAKFIEECKNLDLEYCIKINSIQDKTLSAYKIYTKDGREEPVYGAEFNNMSTRSLRDIAYAADDSAAYNLTNGDVSASIIAPSIIVSEVEVIPTQVKPGKLPAVPKP